MKKPFPWFATLCVPPSACAAPAGAQENFPAGPIRLIVPQTTGTGGDILARIMGEKIKQDLGQTVIVDNRAGANGVIAMAFLAKQPPDGYTLLLAPSNKGRSGFQGGVQ